MFRKLSILIALGAIAVAGGAGNAGAQDGACLAFTDPAGDQRLPGAIGVAPGGTAAANMDVKGATFRMITDKAGKPQLAVDVATDLSDKSITPGWNSHAYWVIFTVGEQETLVTAELNSDGSWTYRSGTQGADGFDLSGAGSGRVLRDGADGLIQIDIKSSAKTLGAPYVMTRAMAYAGGQPVLASSQSDRAPDSGGDDLDRANCPGAAAPPTTTPPTPASLDVTAGKSKARGKTVRVALSGNATNLTGSLKKGRKTVATGKLAKLAGKATMKLKGRKKVKKGAYKLTLTGTTSDGRSASKTLSVKAR